MRSKYGAIRTTVNGIEYDSRKEAKRHQELLYLQKAGMIHNLKTQVEFELIPAQYEVTARYGKKGKRLKDRVRCIERGVSYIADFVYEENGKKVVEDTKGAKTKDYIIKRKLMLYVHGIRVREV